MKARTILRKSIVMVDEGYVRRWKTGVDGLWRSCRHSVAIGKRCWVEQSS